jgi:uncharacterized protein with GYD domain
MAKFIVFFSFKPETVAAMIESPDNRVDAVRRLVEGAHGKLESYYWMQGKFDGFLIAEASPMDANAMSLAVSSSGVMSHIETHELIDPSDIMPLLAQAKAVRAQYQPPGKTTVGAR